MKKLTKRKILAKPISDEAWIRNNPKVLKEIRQGLKEIEQGKFYTFEQVFGKRQHKHKKIPK